MKNQLAIRCLSAVLTFVVLLNLFLYEVTIRQYNEAATIATSSMRSSHFKRDWQLNATASNNTATTSISTTKNRWQDSKIIPSWMKEYFEWHSQIRQQLNESNWQDYHYLLQRCVKADKKCSGASDRLKAIPSVIRMAYTAQPRRLLFLAWSRPAPLEDFLVPPTGGFDWRVPAWLADKIHVEQRGPKFWLDDASAMQQWPSVPDRVVRIKNIRGSEYYEKMRAKNEPSFQQVYKHVWNTVFEPSPAVATRIQQEFQSLNLLQSHHYVAVHVRALYVSDTREQGEEERALQCAAQLLPSLSTVAPARHTVNHQMEAAQKAIPVYFASDSKNVTQRALAYGNSHDIAIVTRTSGSEPIHLDRGRSFLQNSDDWKKVDMESFYDIFVDLFLLASSRCVIYGVGGYGEWAALLSQNYTCSINYRNTQCSVGPSSNRHSRPLF